MVQAWAYANLGYEAGDLLTSIEAAAIRRVDSFSPQNMSNTLWAFAKLNQAAPALLQAATAHALNKLRQYQPQSIANTIWAFATLAQAQPKKGDGTPLAQQPDKEFLDAMLGWGRATLKEFSPQNISNTVWALATLKYQDVVGAGPSNAV